MKNNAYDEQEYSAFVLNGSRISTDDRDEDEQDPYFIDEIRTITDETRT